MKIGKTVKPVDNQTAGETRVRSEKGAPAAEAPAASDKVELSSLSATLQQAEAAMADVSIVDQNRVDEIKQSMSDGNFKVDAEKVADGLIESAREALQAQTPKE